MVCLTNYSDGINFDMLTVADFQTVARSDWLSQKGFSGHNSQITAASWSPNGALLATAAADKSLILWETRTQKILKKSVGCYLLNRFHC
jgi:WD40 repeat protein